MRIQEIRNQDKLFSKKICNQIKESEKKKDFEKKKK